MSACRALALTCIAGLILVVGCASDDDTAERITRTGSPSVEERPNGKLTKAPPPLTTKDLAQTRGGGPEKTVMALWFYGQWGSPPDVVSLYDERVQRELGPEVVAGAYASVRLEMLATRPKILATRKSPRGTLVLVNLLSASSPPQQESFLLERGEDGWRIIHDTYLERLVPPFIQAAAQARFAPESDKLDPRAARAGVEAASRFRNLLLGEPPPEAESPPPEAESTAPGAAEEAVPVEP